MKIWYDLKSFPFSARGLLEGNNFQHSNWEEAEAALIRSNLKITKDKLKAAPNLKIIITMTAGLDHINWQAIRESAVQVMQASKANSEAAAELSLLLMLELMRGSRSAERSLIRGDFRPPVRGESLYKKTLGIVGYGRVGQKLAKLVQPFEMNILVHDPYLEEQNLGPIKVSHHSLHELFRMCDIVSFHVPLTRKTKNIMTTAAFADCADGVYLINTARGELFKSEDLVESLNKGYLAGVALDVFQDEPLPLNHKLINESKNLNLILSPHIGAWTESANLSVSQEAIEKLLKWRDSNTLTNTLPPKAAWWDPIE